MVKSQMRSITIKANSQDYFNFTDLKYIPGYTRAMFRTTIANSSTNGFGSSYVNIYSYGTTTDSFVIYVRNYATTVDAVVDINVEMTYISTPVLNGSGTKYELPS
jgi:hypothetical protein